MFSAINDKQTCTESMLQQQQKQKKDTGSAVCFPAIVPLLKRQEHVTTDDRYYMSHVLSLLKAEFSIVRCKTNSSIHNLFTCRITISGPCPDLPCLIEFSDVVLRLFQTLSPDQFNGSVTQLNRKTRSGHGLRQLFIQGHGSRIAKTVRAERRSSRLIG